MKYRRAPDGRGRPSNRRAVMVAMMMPRRSEQKDVRQSRRAPLPMAAGNNAVFRQRYGPQDGLYAAKAPPAALLSEPATVPIGQSQWRPSQTGNTRHAFLPAEVSFQRVAGNVRAFFRLEKVSTDCEDGGRDAERADVERRYLLWNVHQIGHDGSAWNRDEKPAARSFFFSDGQ